MRRVLVTSNWVSLLVVGCSWFVAFQPTLADDVFEQPPIRYSASESKDPVGMLKSRLERGEVVLRKEKQFGYLRDVLRELNVQQESQVLVFSKTSFQIHKISPTNPRAIYFSDSIYVGYVPGSDTIELAANDPSLGAVFYTLDGGDEDATIEDSTSVGAVEASASGKPHEATNASRVAHQGARLLRDRGQCLSCHATSRTENVPGYLVRSVFPDRSGRPRTGSSSYTTDYRSPFGQRWGGWYVTGTHGQIRHMGNAFALDREDPQKMDMETGANLTELPDRVRPSLHLLPQSDLVALMVLEHQVRIHNLITKANYEARQSIAMDETMNQALGRDRAYRSESTQRRINAAANALADGLFFRNEPPLESGVSGNSLFAAEFSRLGPRTQQGESLRDLDLQTRLFRYPLSYLIYTPEFRELPKEIMSIVQSQLREQLSRSDSDFTKQSPNEPCWSQQERMVIKNVLQQSAPWMLD